MARVNHDPTELLSSFHGPSTCVSPPRVDGSRRCASPGWGPQETGVLATMLLRQLDIATDDCVRMDWTTRRAAVQQALTTTWVALLRRP
jgi:hypothetical protein